jgi:hypothetical protein
MAYGTVNADVIGTSVAGSFKEYFDYRDGKLFWKKNTGDKYLVGQEAGCAKTTDKYVTVGFKKKQYHAHGIIFAMHNGYIPKMIDHINGDRTDNRIENLRAATNYQNSLNKGLQSNNTSGVKGVSWDKAKKKWHAQLTYNGKHRHLGYWVAEEKHLAQEFIELAREMTHGVFANHGAR